MAKRKIKPYPILNEWLEEIVKNLWETKTKGTKPVLSQLLQSLINDIMLKKWEIFLKEYLPKRVEIVRKIWNYERKTRSHGENQK